MSSEATDQYFASIGQFLNESHSDVYKKSQPENKLDNLFVAITEQALNDISSIQSKQETLKRYADRLSEDQKADKHRAIVTEMKSLRKFLRIMEQIASGTEVAFPDQGSSKKPRFLATLQSLREFVAKNEGV